MKVPLDGLRGGVEGKVAYEELDVGVGRSHAATVLVEPACPHSVSAPVSSSDSSDASNLLRPLGHGNVDADGTTIELRVVEVFNAQVRTVDVRHGDHSEAPGATRVLVVGDEQVRNGGVLSENVLQALRPHED